MINGKRTVSISMVRCPRVATLAILTVCVCVFVLRKKTSYRERKATLATAVS